MRQDRLLLLVVVVFLCLLAACSGPDESEDTSAYLNFADILPADWQYVDTHRLDTNRDDEKEWVVMYRFDLLTGTERRDGPIAAVVYQPDDRKPPCVIPYELLPQDGSYLCECKCTPTMENVLSGLEGDELVVRDDCDEEITRLAIFYWDPSAEEEYLPKGHFSGDRITSSPNEVTVDRRLPDRAQLAIRQTCYPDEENKTYYWLEGQDTVVCEKYEYIFYDGEPEDVMLSPYPEKVVLAFYNHYTDGDKDVSQYFTEDGWERVDKCAAGQCGCTVARNKVKDVRVIYLLPGEETCSQTPVHQCEKYGPDRAIVETTVICEHKNEDQGEDQQQILEWRLVREGARWKLDSVDVKQTQTGGSEGGEQ